MTVPYIFVCKTYRNGKLVHEREGVLNSVELYQQIGSVGLINFLLLLNRWNNQGLRQGLLYVYTYKEGN